jgi:hypothetical protein
MQRDPALAQRLHNEAIALAQTGRYAEARSTLLAAIRSAGEAEVDPRTLKALWQVARNEGDWKTALAAGFRGAVRDPLDFRFVDSVVRTLHQCPLAALVPDTAFPAMAMPVHPPSLSVVIVSQDDARYAAVGAQFDKAFAVWPHERIRVKGAASMYDGYARGYARARGDIVVFSHDDIRFAVPDFAARLADVMAQADVAGVAGTTRVAGPALLWSGHPHLHGAVTHQAPGEASCEFALLSLRGPRIAGAQGIDGVLIAARREWIGRVGFDAQGIPGFHFYDLDFSYRAFLAGARITIAADLALIHCSRGNFDAAWGEASSAFAAKHPALDAAKGAHRHWYAVSLPDEDAVAAHCAKLYAAWQLELPPQARERSSPGSGP